MSKQVSRERCHECGTNMRFELDMSLNGNHVIHCPKCNHEHCRVIENGKVTGDRWDSRNVPAFYFTASYDTAGTSSSTFMRDSWLQTTAGSSSTSLYSVTST